MVFFERSTISKLICGCKYFEIKNGDSFIEVDVLLFVASSVIINISDQSSCS